MGRKHWEGALDRTLADDSGDHLTHPIQGYPARTPTAASCLGKKAGPRLMILCHLNPSKIHKNYLSIYYSIYRSEGRDPNGI